jgi:1-acyl-sn-glycerol-3-phosphate acyltransferase
MILALGRVSLKVKGLSRIDPNQQYIFMANHQSNLDIPVLVQSLTTFQLRWIAKQELLRVPFFGWAMWASKHITVARGNRLDALSSLRKAQESITAGISVVVFPEGTRSAHGALLPFKKGGFLLATQTGTPVVPLTINGSGALLPAGAWRLRPGTIEIVIADPIAVESYRPGNLRMLSERVRTAIAAHLRDPSPSTSESPRLMTKSVGRNYLCRGREQ